MTLGTVVVVALGVYGVASAVTFVAYALDKRAARRSNRRIPEKTLHLMELAGGWPGALLAQRTLRHKTVDVRFRVVFWAIVALHMAGWAAALWLWAR